MFLKTHWNNILDICTHEPFLVGKTKDCGFFFKINNHVWGKSHREIQYMLCINRRWIVNCQVCHECMRIKYIRVLLYRLINGYTTSHKRLLRKPLVRVTIAMIYGLFNKVKFVEMEENTLCYIFPPYLAYRLELILVICLCAYLGFSWA